ncbi:MAG: hypothetical protein LWY06_01620 [Firmicutes bacterium]|nr:hypothetical protein [Bacillota bacterium]
MKIIFFSSENARFLLGLEGRDISLVKENRDVWKRKIKYNNFEVLGVGNNGNVYIKADEGIVLFPPDSAAAEKILPWLDNNTLSNEGASIVKAVMHKSGERLCVQKMSMKSKLTEKLFKILSSSPKMEKGQALHELLFYDAISGRQTVFHKFAIDRKVPHAFTWSISRDFHYLIISEAQKVFKGTETRFSIASVIENSILDQFVLEGLTEWILMINSNGTYLIDSPQKREPRELLVGTPRSHTYKLTISNEYRAEHLGKDFVAFQSRMEPRLIFKRYDNSIVQEVDFAPLRELKLDFQTVFSDSDDIVLVTRSEGEVKLVHTSKDSIAIDAKRWQMMSEQQKIDDEIDKKKNVLEEKQKTLKDKKAKLKSAELSKTALESRQLRSRQDEPLAPKTREQGDLQFIFGDDASASGEIERRRILEAREREALNKIAEANYGDKTRMIDSYPTSSLSAPPPVQEKSAKRPALISFETVDLSDKPLVFEDRTQKKPLTESFLEADTKIISLEDELQKYIPSVEIEVDEDELELEQSAPSMAEISLPNLRTPPPRRKKMPDRLELEIGVKKSIREKTEPDIAEEEQRTVPVVKIDFSPRDRKKAHEPQHFEENRKTSRQSIYETDESLTEGDYDLSGFDASGFAPLQDEESWDMTEKDEELINSAFGNTGYGLETQAPVVETTKDDEARLAEIKRQIEREIQEAVLKKKTDTKQDDQKKKYVQLLEELEESFINGGISEESYYRLRARYEDRIEEIEKSEKL